MKLSAIIIAKNAEELLKDCIESVTFCDEIIVVDDNSTDKTVHIAKLLHAKVIKGIENNFAENRTIGLKEARGEWVLYIDTDERVSVDLKKEIEQTVSSSEFAAYKLKRKNFYFGNHEWPKIEELERLFKKENLKGWYGKLHETPRIEGSVGILHGYLLHFTHRDLASMLDKTIQWSKIEAKLRMDVNHPKIVWWRLIRVMMTGFFDSYIQQGGWKAGTAGFIESMYQAYSMFVTYATLWEMQNKSEK
ncbi:MAG TPA: glycosyltransferase family 2 protein [Patescibacteria group bacterium]|nr:glycosyltransferase family 2 protein [Patescibacteria group bacterium]